MDNQRDDRSGSQRPGYHTPGQDKVVESTSSAVPSPSRPSEQRIQDPKPAIESINARPGEANPALDETVGAEQGLVSTADMLRAREAAEEQNPRSVGDAHPYQDQGTGEAPDEYERSDTGRPNWPTDRQEDPVEYMDAPRANAPLGTGAPDVYSFNLKGRTDAAVERGSTQASGQESRSGLPPVGFTAEEDNYENREMQKPSEPSDLDRIAPGMANIPDEENDER
jgi:hypothetical protein